MRYFSISELCNSSVARINGIDNVPNQDQIKNLNELVSNVLDPLRESLGFPITVTSGFRCKTLNEKVKGSTTSQHMNGEAADLVCKDNKKLFDCIKDNFEFDQLIWENGGEWVHVSFRKGNNRKQILNIG